MCATYFACELQDIFVVELDIGDRLRIDTAILTHRDILDSSPEP